MIPPALSVRNLAVAVSLRRRDGARRVVDGISFDVGRGEIVGLVGRSGSGKSMTALAVLRLLPQGVRIESGEILIAGSPILGLPEQAMGQVRGKRLAYVPQDAGAALDPTMRIGRQVGEPLRLHRRMSRRAAWEAAVRLLGETGIPDAAERARDYPHQFSGGMQQRALVAAAMAVDAELIVADEPTSALDARTAEAILGLLSAARDRTGVAVLLISHDIASVARWCDRIVVIDGGRLVETGPAWSVVSHPSAAPTRALVAAAIPPLILP